MTRGTLASLLLLAVSAQAQPTTNCRVRSVHAFKGTGAVEVDAKLEPLRPLLTKAPFDQFQRFKLLDEQRADTEIGKKTSQTLPNGKTLQLTLLERIASKKRNLLRLKVEYPGLTTTYKVGEGDPIPLVLGAHQSGTLILAVDCETRGRR